MTDALRRCPNCGAYVMGGDNTCPRCDFDLTANADSARPADSSETRDVDPPFPDLAEAADAEIDPDDDPPLPDSTSRAPATEILPAADASEPPGAQEPDADAGAGESGVDSTPARGTPRPVPDESPDSAPESTAARDAFAEMDTLPEEPDSGAEDTADAAAGTDSHPAPPAPQDTPAHAPPSPAESTPQAAPQSVEATQERAQPEYLVPPAPYAPPPVIAPPPPASYAAPWSQREPRDAVAYVQQRVQDYMRGGYRVLTHGHYEASLTYGKPIGVGTWILALITLIGAVWYLLVLAVSGFQRDVVYIVLENDGRVYEDGPGAAHIRRKRARTGRHWSAFGLLIFFLSLITAIVLGVVGGIVISQDRYQAAVREAYPAVTLFEDHFSTQQASPDDVALAKDGAVAFAALAVIAAVGLWGGVTLFVIGTIHASAFNVRVPPLPGWA